MKHSVFIFMLLGCIAMPSYAIKASETSSWQYVNIQSYHHIGLSDTVTIQNGGATGNAYSGTVSYLL